MMKIDINIGWRKSISDEENRQYKDKGSIFYP
jgi:hypothetical protein